MRKLTAEQMRVMRERRAAGERCKDIASDFEVSAGYASDVCRGRVSPDSGGPLTETDSRPWHLTWKELGAWLPQNGTRTDSGCLEWNGARGIEEGKGYGHVRFGGRTRRVHRVAYAYAHGLDEEELEEIEAVGHRCDNPPCFESSHLFPTTNEGNVKDKVRKGRQYGRVVELREEQIPAIRQMYWAGCGGYGTIAEYFGIGAMTARDAIKGITWARVPEDAGFAYG